MGKNINILKNINLLNQIFYFFVILLLSTFFKFNVQAHELWLEPVNFKFNNKEVSEIHINIGQNFIGSPFGYYDPNKKSLYLENINKVKDLPQRDGNFPAIQTLILDKGFHILNYETNYEFLKYESVEKFEDFLKEQAGLSQSYSRYQPECSLPKNQKNNFKIKSPMQFYCIHTTLICVK